MLYRYTFLCAILVTTAGVLLEKNYGKYTVNIISYDIQNFKPFAKIGAEQIYFDNGTSTLAFGAVITKDLGFFGVKIRWFAWDESVKKFSRAINIVMKNVCEKQFAKEILAMIKGLGRDCKVMHGVYNFTIQNFDGLIHSLMLDKFFYGKFRTITDIITERYGRVMKINVTVSIDPIK